MRFDRTPDQLSTYVVERFDAIAGDEAANRKFREGIGGPGAPSRQLIASMCRGAKSILDVGCGPGVQLDTFLDAWPGGGWTYTGVDTSERLVAQAVTSHPHGVDFRLLDDPARLPFPDRSYDAVVVRHVLEHTPDPRPLLRECCRVAARIVCAVFSHWPSRGFAFPLMVDSYLDVPRWAHPSDRLRRQFHDDGFAAVRVLDWSPDAANGLAPRESFWFAEREVAVAPATGTLA